MIKELNTTNWAEAFGEAAWGPAENDSPGFRREDVAVITAAHEECGAHAEWIGVCLGRLRDGRWWVVRHNRLGMLRRHEPIRGRHRERCVAERAQRQ